MSTKAILVTLKSNGKVLTTLEVKKGCDPILIGRSRSCKLRAPADDNSVSGKHANLFWKGGSLYLEDAGSRNGVFFNGHRLNKPIKVEPDGLYAIGNCLLVASFPKKGGGSRGLRYHQVEFLNGDRARQLIDIKPKNDGKDGVFTIGLDPQCDICLPDMLVSRKHAKLTVRPNGDCWITDEGSRNGTYVNGEKLGVKERFLRDGDKISIAYFDMRFLDRNVVHSRAYLWAKMGVLLITLCILVTAYVIWQYIAPRPTAADYRNLAVKSAEEERFAEAIAYADEAKMARNAGAEKIQNDALQSQLKRWNETYDEWKKAQGELGRGEIPVARRRITALMGSPDFWMWNSTTAPAMRKEAEFANVIVRLCSDTAITLKNAETDVGVKELVDRQIQKIDEFLAANRAVINRLPYLAPTVKLISLNRGKLETIQKGIGRIDAALSGVKDADPDFSAAVAEFSHVADDAALPPGVRLYARTLLPVCKAFTETQAFLEKEKVKVTDMEFEEVLKNVKELPLPSKDICARQAKFSDARATFQKRHAAYQQEVTVLGPMMRNLESAGIRNGEKGHLLTYVCNPVTWGKALSFDCFNNHFPLSSRVDPSGVYDELVGIEHTYENLRELPKAPGQQTAVLMNFVPRCQVAKAAFKQVRTFLTFMDRPEGREFRSGKLGRLYALGAQILADREQLIAMLRKQSKDAVTERARIVAGYYVEYFSDEPSYADLRSLEMAFRKLQKQVNELNERYGAEPDPEKRLAIRKTILENGIPGMEAVRMRWVEVESE